MSLTSIVVLAAVAANGLLAGTRVDQLGKRLPAVPAGVLAVLHSAATSQAAPTMFSQRRVRGDEAALVNIFDRFARWQGVRCGLQLANFFALLWLWTNLSTIAELSARLLAPSTMRVEPTRWPVPSRSGRGLPSCVAACRSCSSPRQARPT
jgi:hypothetical protein